MRWQPVVKVRRRTEAGDAPSWQGATRLRQGFGEVSPKFAAERVSGERRRTTEKYREYLSEEQRSQAGCSAGQTGSPTRQPRWGPECSRTFAAGCWGLEGNKCP